MVGGSYSGSVQLAAAIESPPHLVTIIPNITPATPFNNTPYENGVFALGWGIRWTDIVHQNITGKEMNEKFGQVFQRNWYNDLNSLPVIELDKKIIGQEVDFWRKWIEMEPSINDYYNDQNYLSHISKITIPVFIQSGWFDVANRGTKLIYEQLAQAGNKNVKMIIGPWVHSDRSSKQLGPLYLGEEAGIDLFELYAKWFDYWLKGENNGIMNDPLIQIFNIGPNDWIYSNEYPSNKSEESNLFIMPINAGEGIIDGVLSFEENVEVVTSTSYSYDPGNPTPSFQAFMKKRKIVEYKKYIETREDLIIFETAPLKDSLTISGPISAVIYASSTALDTDFNLTLTGVNSNNEIIPIGQTFGIIRAKYRNPLNPELLEKDKVYEYTIDLSHTCYTLAPGEKLRLEIASASFPEFARNLNTGENNLTTVDFIEAVQTIYFSNEYPSRLIFSSY
jgi:putative CocE/NonD family hydrolase